MSGSKRAMRAATIVCGSVLLMTIVSLSLTEISALRLYERSVAFEPGPWFAEHIAPSIGNPNSCIIVGASTAREGFDAEALTKSLPRLLFLNASTTGGNIEVTEIQAQILRRYGVRAKCILVGVHPFLMMDQSPPLLASTGYLAQLTVADLLSLSDRAAVGREIIQILQATVLPFKAHADRLNKLLRIWIFELQSELRTNPLPLSSYEYFADEFRPGAGAHYDGSHSSPAAVAEMTQTRYRTYTYESNAPEASFRRALALFRAQAENVIVVTMPSQTSLRELNSSGSGSYKSAIRESGVAEIDCSSLVPDVFFIDDAHLDVGGRRILTDAIAHILPKVMESSPSEMKCE